MDRLVFRALMKDWMRRSGAIYEWPSEEEVDEVYTSILSNGIKIGHDECIQDRNDDLLGGSYIPEVDCCADCY